MIEPDPLPAALHDALEAARARYEVARGRGNPVTYRAALEAYTAALNAYARAVLGSGGDRGVEVSLGDGSREDTKQ